MFALFLSFLGGFFKHLFDNVCLPNEFRCIIPFQIHFTYSLRSSLAPFFVEVWEALGSRLLQPLWPFSSTQVFSFIKEKSKQMWPFVMQIMSGLFKTNFLACGFANLEKSIIFHFCLKCLNCACKKAIYLA